MRHRPDEEVYDDDGPGPGPVGRMMRGASTALGAVLALALAAGGGIWLYRLGVRDAANVPVIRASLDPSKELPDEPGGVETPHQDIGSYSLADAQPGAPTQATLAPPPPRPGADDLAPADLQPRPAPVAATVTPVTPGPGAVALADPAPVPERTIPEATAPEADAPEASAPEASAPEARAPETAADPDLTRAVEQALADAAAAATAPVPGDQSTATPLAPPASPVVRARPADLAERVATAGREAVAEQGALASTAAKSAIKLQLGAFPTRAFTESEWARIARANSDLLGNRALIVETTVSGGTTWYRLRVGPFRDRAEANSICEALKARAQDCIVATNG